MSLLDQLNPQQREAVEATEGPLLILAGAGSGKTRVITYRIAHLIDSCGVSPERMLAVTFTNKAAQEMRSRIERLVRTPRVVQPWISTFHSFCVRLLRQDGSRIGLSRDFSIYDESDQLAVVKACMRQLGLSDRELKPRGVLSRISYAKNHGRNPEEFFEASTDPLSEKVAVVYGLYTKALKQASAVDFDDLLLEAVRLLEEDAEAALKYNDRFRYILVDEYQDTNRAQYELVRLLTQTQQNLCVVGDEDQSIYSWRGADIRNIVEFEKDYPQARIIRLEQNYRSTQHILDAAAAVVANNRYRKGKALWTARDGGQKIGLYEAPDAENEGLFVADWIAKRQRDQPGEKSAILYRTNAQSRLYEEALRRYGLKYSLVGGISFYERAEVKDLLAYLKTAANPQDSVSLLRIINSPPRGIGQKTVRKLEELALENGLSLWDGLRQAVEQEVFPTRAASALKAFHRLMEGLRKAALEENVPEMLRTIIERTRYTALLEEDGTPEALGRIENIQELLNAATDSMERGENLAEFLDHAALVSDTDGFDEEALITLMTLHSAKGLEFPAVFMGGLEEGLLPHNRSLPSENALEEERRLCYVGMTRAQDILILTRAESRRHYGSQMPELSMPSRFLSEIPEHLLEDLSSPPSFAASPNNERVYEYDPAELEGMTVQQASVGNVHRYFGSRSESKRAASKPRGAFSGFVPGSRVRHPKYGYGTVLRREGEGEESKLTVSFPGLGLKKLVEKYARLERV
ncbi:MAG: UvrD-helicase domain-containing protein [Acidobacteria bacterium]|nr:UvrD-helicase domain-containing protein [Acidobacteriota bacterium]